MCCRWLVPLQFQIYRHPGLESEPDLIRVPVPHNECLPHNIWILDQVQDDDKGGGEAGWMTSGVGWLTSGLRWLTGGLTAASGLITEL